MRNERGLCQVCRHVDRELLKEKGLYKCLLTQKVRENPVDQCDWFYPSHLTESEKVDDSLHEVKKGI